MRTVDGWVPSTARNYSMAIRTSFNRVRLGLQGKLTTLSLVGATRRSQWQHTSLVCRFLRPPAQSSLFSTQSSVLFPGGRPPASCRAPSPLLQGGSRSNPRAFLPQLRRSCPRPFVQSHSRPLPPPFPSLPQLRCPSAQTSFAKLGSTTPRSYSYRCWGKVAQVFSRVLYIFHRVGWGPQRARWCGVKAC